MSSYSKPSGGWWGNAKNGGLYGGSKSVSNARRQTLPGMFQVKMIKERQNEGIKERLAREQQQREEEVRELAARQAVKHILMDHNVT